MEDLKEALAYIRETYDVDKEIHMRDRSGRRWCRCIHCGELKPTDNMPIYGGPGKEMNRGQCRMYLYYLGFVDIPQR